MKSKTNVFLSDLRAGLTVFLVAVPLCLGIALACKVPIEAGLFSGISGGIVTGLVSGSQTSVSGPSAGFVAVVLDAISHLHSYNLFLCSVIWAGIFQIIFGFLRLGRFGNYIPSSVINGLLVAIGLILILKQIPHLFGYEATPTGDFDFLQGDDSNTFTEIFKAIQHMDMGALIIGLTSLVTIWFMNRYGKRLTKYVPASLFAVFVGILLAWHFQTHTKGTRLEMSNAQLVNIPSGSLSKIFHFPAFSGFAKLDVIKFGLTLAIVISLEALLSVSAGDKLDRQKRHTPVNRELIAQGCGNMASGLLGGIPLTSVVVRTAINVDSGGKTKFATISHGIFLMLSVLCIPRYMNMIPLSSLAAVLIYSGWRLVVNTNLKRIFKNGKQYYIPFVATTLFIMFTNVLIGVCAGMALGFVFVLKANYVKSFSFKKYKYHAGEVLKIHLPQEISFLNKPSLVHMLDSIPKKSSVIIDASHTDYIDQDALDAIKEFKKVRAKLHHIKVSTIGFHRTYDIENRMHITSSVTKEVQKNITPQEVLVLLKEGNKRFATNNRIGHDFKAQMTETAQAQNPLVVILSCMDSRAIPETIFDLGIGEALIVRVAGNVTNQDITGSLEFGCKVLGAKLVLVLGHTECGAVKAACDNGSLENATPLIQRIQRSVHKCNHVHDDAKLVNEAIKMNVVDTAAEILEMSNTLTEMVKNEEIKICGGVYNIKTGYVEFLK
ncbi:bifunctional SulP family inorganic anion transporter/carbonic anhydrase [Candidatus Deianiraea vastatrix]|uniref:MFS transporter/carbonic anhydrase n=1 Tax=Candidatus Deianiraea vastatrix TaxID=2163644 RepID=A0A5B8XI05_9RICK|nr:bifunctional SulP family inorganic anion transporter/carbonic anhydrase [Candidatus Deianiraea vastatrix]QED23387.1 Putative MFS transporter/carbonic anhydrase [Candidatus Deianiraea vastatrix]